MVSVGSPARRRASGEEGGNEWSVWGLLPGGGQAVRRVEVSGPSGVSCPPVHCPHPSHSPRSPQSAPFLSSRTPPPVRHYSIAVPGVHQPGCDCVPQHAPGEEELAVGNFNISIKLLYI